MFIFAFSICILTYMVLALIIKKFPARGKFSLKLLVFAILFFKLVAIKALIFFGIVRK